MRKLRKRDDLLHRIRTVDALAYDEEDELAGLLLRRGQEGAKLVNIAIGRHCL